MNGRPLFPVLLASFLITWAGCAALLDTPARLKTIQEDPIRARHLIGRVLESCVGGGAAGSLLAFPLGLIGCPVAVATDFLVYEYILEPLGLVGPYFERGPRLPVIQADGQVAEPGEIYRESTEAFCKFHKKTWHPDPHRPSGGWCE